MSNFSFLKDMSYSELEALKSEIDKHLSVREKEKQDLEKILEFAKSLGYKSIEQLGLTTEKVKIGKTESVSKSEKVVKPKLRLLKKEHSEFYHDENSKWQLITAPTLRDKLAKAGQEIFKYSEIAKEDIEAVDLAYKRYADNAKSIYNSKVEKYNEYAEKNNLEKI